MRKRRPVSSARCVFDLSPAPFVTPIREGRLPRFHVRPDRWKPGISGTDMKKTTDYADDTDKRKNDSETSLGLSAITQSPHPRPSPASAASGGGVRAPQSFAGQLRLRGRAGVRFAHSTGQPGVISNDRSREAANLPYEHLDSVTRRGAPGLPSRQGL